MGRTEKTAVAETSLSRAGFDPLVGAKKNHSSFVALPSKLIARHVDNHDRAPMYSLRVELPELAGHPAFGKGDDADKFCFARADVLKRAESFKRVGQEQRIRVCRTNTGAGKVTAGYLRHAAALYLEVAGELAACPGMVTGIRFDGEDQARTAEQQLESVWHSSAENERKETSPIDFAWKCKRLLALQVSRKEIAERLEVSLSYVDKTLRLLTLSVATQLAVHEGRLPMTKALADASEAGEGSARGPDSGVKKSAIVRALSTTPRERPQPEKSLTPKQVAELVSALVGAVDAEKTSESVQEWVRWLDCPKPEKVAAVPVTSEPKVKRERKPKTEMVPGVSDAKGRKAPRRVDIAKEQAA
jgi:hypothetical protein